MMLNQVINLGASSKSDGEGGQRDLPTMSHTHSRPRR